MFDFEDGFPFDAAEAVKATAARIWEALAHRLEKLGTAAPLAELEDVIDAYRSDGSHVCDLDLDDQISVCEYLAEDDDLPVSRRARWSELRRTIAETSDLCVVTAAQAECRTALSNLRDLLEELGADVSSLERENSFGSLPHRSERREEKANAQVYEYRRPEGGEIDVDVWEVEVFPGSRIYLCVSPDREEVGR